MKKILFVLLGIMTAFNCWADKGYPFPVEVRQSDGTTLTIVLHGDEDFHYYTTLDGILLVQRDGGYYIGSVDAEGTLTATELLAHNSGERSALEMQQASLQNREAFFSTAETHRGILRSRREPIDSTGQRLFPHKGSPRAVVILAEFSDSAHHFTIENPKRSFHEYFNATKPLEDHGRGENRNFVSVRQYFKLASFGQFIPDFDVYGPVTLPSNLATYGADSGGEGKGERMDLLFQDACMLLNDSIDFSQYDSNNDDYVDLVIIIYAGYSQSMSGNSSDCIWPKSGTISGGTYDGKRVQRYAVSAELNGFPGCWSTAPWERINGIGTLCHEFCHTMGLPDFYPTGNAWKGDNQGMEYWSLMDSGNYLSNGYTPCALNAWEREAMEWMEIPLLDTSGEMEVKPLDEGGTAYRIVNPSNSREYFLLENIQNIGLNSYQKGHGLLVTHVEYDPSSFSIRSGNNVNNIKGHPRMTVVPADGLLFAQYNVGTTIGGKVIKNADFYAELAGDPFPGTKGVTELNDTMEIVNYNFYTNGDKTNKALANIIESNDGVVTFTYIDDFDAYTLAVPTVLAPQEATDAIYTIDGRRVKGELDGLPHGIYIHKGKKVVR
ncbi:MAG: M6 family metalloprotease domain-containing protein [Prevotella sp.]|nr:M6 family metalloprotease domain-containing protein [Prevotella sp.]